MSNPFEELEKAGLVKTRIFNKFEDDQQKETTASSSIATTVKPLGGDEEEGQDESDETEGKYEEKLAEAIKQMSEVYESMTGNNIHEVYCPKCTADDMSSAPGQTDHRDKDMVGSEPDQGDNNEY